jgi:transposase
MDVAPHQFSDLDELRRRIRREANAKQRDRYRVVLLALEGKTEPEIRERTDRSRGFVQRWVYVYRDRGLDAIGPIKQSGRPTKLPRQQEQAFLDRIRHAGRILRGHDIVEILKQEFGVCYTLQGAYDLLHRLGYEPLKPRPVNPKKDPQAEAAWKQAAPLLSKPSEASTPTKTSRSGSRTSADSARRDA